MATPRQTPGKRVTIRDVARVCGVDISTVSRILNKRFENFSASEEKIRRVHEAANLLGYRPNRFAQSLRTQRSTFLGVSSPTLPAAYQPQTGSADDPDDYTWLGGNLLRGMIHTAFEAGYVVMMLPRDENRGGPIANDEIAPQIVAGTIYTMPTSEHPEYLSLHARDRPLVLMGRGPSGASLPSCDLDNELEIQRLMRHLYARGARRIALLLPVSQQYLLAQDRRAGYLRALLELGLPVRGEWLLTQAQSQSNPADNMQWCREQLKRLLTDSPEIDGLILGADVQLGEILNTVEAVRPDWRQTLRIGTFFWTPEYRRDYQEIAMLQVRYYQMGVEAIGLLLRLLRGEETSETICVPCKLVA